MGNLCNGIKNQNDESNCLSRTLLHDDLHEKINYLIDKVEFLDDKIYVLEANTQANIKVLSADIHYLDKHLNLEK